MANTTDGTPIERRHFIALAGSALVSLAFDPCAAAIDWLDIPAAQRRGPKVIVIGAGLAGICAARTLAKSGCEVLVLERGDSLGGRISTLRGKEFVFDRAAVFFADNSPLLPKLISEVGLESDITPVGRKTIFIRQGSPIAVDFFSKLGAATTPLLSLASKARFALGVEELKRECGKLSLDEYGSWHSHDSELASTWIESEFGAENKEKLIEPLLNSFFFQEPEEISAAMAKWSLLKLAGTHSLLTLRSGMDQLPTRLAAGLEVRTGVEVTGVSEDSNGVVVATSSGALLADFAILAVPAVAARTLRQAATHCEQRLLDTNYSRTAALVIRARKRCPSVADDGFGVLVSRSERQLISAVSFESTKPGRQVPAGEEILGVFLSERGIRLLETHGVRAVFRATTEEIDRWLPRTLSDTELIELRKWPQAITYSQPGRSIHLQSYWNTALQDSRRVILAGDYMALPYLDGAARSGIMAATAILRQAGRS